MRRFGIVVLGVVLVLEVCVGVSATADAATYYVSPNGRDILGNGSEGDPWKTIGKAVTQASDGDTIKVKAGTDDNDDYVENVLVNKRLRIEGVVVGANPQIKASVADSSVFYVTVDSVVIKGLDIYGVTSNSHAGIYLNRVQGCTIRENRCGWSYSYESDYGISLLSSSDNTISGNTCSNSKYGIGIRLYSSSDNTISDNTCSNNKYGIHLYSSSDNTIYLNSFSGNTFDNVGSGRGTNLWRSSTKVCYVYGSTPQTYKGYVGNHYSDHTTPDANGNGIVDSPKDLPGDEPDDRYPLTSMLDKDLIIPGIA